MRRIFADHASTTPLEPRVAEAMEPWLRENFGNPSSLHTEGREARQAIDVAREIVSGALGCAFGEVVFTGSGTEAVNLAIVGAAFAHEGPRRRILMSRVEHHAALETRPLLERLGFDVEWLDVDANGRVDLNRLESQLGEDVLLVSAMHANNELGTIQDAKEIGRLAHSRGALYHADCVQTFGTLTVSLEALEADLISVSAHKLNGPKGVGALAVKAGTGVQALIVGGGQEREMRAGTEAVASIVGFGQAVRLATAEPDRSARRAAVRDAFLASLEGLTGVSPTVRADDGVLTGHAHLMVEDIDAETMLVRLDRMGVSASSGAACSSGSLLPSHVLIACGYTETQAKHGLRFTFGHEQIPSDGEEAGQRLREAILDVRRARP